MITPTDHYKKHDFMATTLSEVRRKIAEIETYASENKLNVFWRGQMDHTWGLQSSLARSLSSVTVLTDDLLNRVEDQILKEAKEWILDFEQSQYAEPLARLGYLQHHGIPTRLIDFTRNPWVALFFAVEDRDDVDGRIFALLVDNDDVFNSTPPKTPWRKYTQKEVKVWDPITCGVSFPRLRAQDGVLAFGRLPSTQPHRLAYDPIIDKERSLLAEEVRSIFSVAFKLCSLDPIPLRATMPVGLTFRIHVNKESIRRDLEKKAGGPRICANPAKIHHNFVYPDADGMRTHSGFLSGLRKNTLILP